MIGQQNMFQQQPISYHDSRGQFTGQPQQVEGRRSSFLTQQFRQEPQPQSSSLQVHRRESQRPKPQLSFDDNLTFSNSLSKIQPLSDVSSSSRRVRVTNMQRMLKAPCSGCLQERGADEASTHPQIYCVHLPSAVRQSVLLDHEQWKQMCASGQEAEEGEIESDVDIPRTLGHDSTASIKQESQEEHEKRSLTVTSPSIDLKMVKQERSSSMPTANISQELEQHHMGQSFGLPELNGRPDDFPAADPQVHRHSPVRLAETASDAIGGIARESDAGPLAQEDMRTTNGGLSDNWASDSIRELLELKSAAEPGTPLEIAVALQQELQKCLLLDVTEGNPQDGEPSAIGLLRVLDQRIEFLQGRPADE